MKNTAFQALLALIDDFTDDQRATFIKVPMRIMTLRKSPCSSTTGFLRRKNAFTANLAMLRNGEGKGEFSECAVLIAVNLSML